MGMQASSITTRIVEAVAERARSGDPVRMLGLTGPPGTGKSTIAAQLAVALPEAGIAVAGLVPMDGFHMSNALLAERGLADHKGAPDTFDVGGYVAMLGRVRRADGIVLAPDYRRDLHEPVAASLAIEVDGVVITEGNYLALETRGWGAVRERIDLLIHIDVPEEVLVVRLINRHEDFGKNALDAGHWVRTVDLPNARLIATSVHRCDEVWREPEDDPDSDNELE